MTLLITATRPRLTVNLAAIAANYRALRDLAPKAEMAAVVKANCYGLGIDRIAPVLLAAGCRTFFVAYSFEGAYLRSILDTDEDVRICIFNGPSDDAQIMIRNRLTPVLNTLQQLRLWQHEGQGPAILHVDTGMNRLGLTAGEIETILADDSLRAVPISHVMSHFSHGSTPRAPQNTAQAEHFAALAERLHMFWPEAKRSLSASAGLFLPLEIEEALIRPGVALYGVGPQDIHEARLHPVASLHAPVVQLREIGEGETCGYGGTFTAKRKTRLATLAIGYADGYMRSLANKGRVLIAGCECPVVGNVSMDLITVDITDCPVPVTIGAMAECFGETLPIEEHARDAGTIGYEVLTALGGRLEKDYLPA